MAEIKPIKIIAKVDDDERTLEKMFKAIQSTAEIGHSFDIIVDPDYSEADGGSIKYYWDGDGQDKILSIDFEIDENKEGRAKGLLTITANDSDNTVYELLNSIKECGNGGHGFTIAVDPLDKDIVGENSNHKDGPTFYWDGDGGDYIESVETVKSGSEKINESRKLNEDWVQDWNMKKVSNMSLGGEKYGGTAERNLDNLSSFEAGLAATEKKRISILEKIDAANDFYMYTSKFQDRKQYKEDMIDLLVLVGSYGHEINLYKKTKDKEAEKKAYNIWTDLTGVVKKFKEKGKMTDEEFKECSAKAAEILKEVGEMMEAAYETYRNQKEEKPEQTNNNEDEHGDTEAGEDDEDVEEEENGSDEAHDDSSYESEEDEELGRLQKLKNDIQNGYNFSDMKRTKMDVAFLFEIREREMSYKYFHKQMGDKDEMEKNSGTLKEIDALLKVIIKESGMDKEDVEQYKQAGISMAQELKQELNAELEAHKKKQSAQPTAVAYRDLLKYHRALSALKSSSLTGPALKTRQKEVRDMMGSINKYCKENGIDQNEFQKLYKKAERELKNGSKMKNESVNKRLNEDPVKDSAGKGEQKKSPSGLEAERGHGDGGRYITVDKHEKTYEQYLEDLERIGGVIGDHDWKVVKGLYARMSVFGDMTKAEYNSYLKGMRKKVNESAYDLDATMQRREEKILGALRKYFKYKEAGDEYNANNAFNAASGIARNAGIGDPRFRELEKQAQTSSSINEEYKVDMGHDYLVKFSMKQLVIDLIKELTSLGGNATVAKKVIGRNKTRIESFYKLLERMPKIKQEDYHAMVEDFASDFEVPNAKLPIQEHDEEDQNDNDGDESIKSNSPWAKSKTREDLDESTKPCTMCELAQVVDDTLLAGTTVLQESRDVSFTKENASEANVWQNLVEHYKTKCNICREKAVTEAMKTGLTLDRFKYLAEAAAQYAMPYDQRNLHEAKINLKLTSNQKRELIKKAKIALDAVYSIYDICEKQGISVKQFTKELDKAFEGTNEMLTILVTQDSILKEAKGEVTTEEGKTIKWEGPSYENTPGDEHWSERGVDETGGHWVRFGQGESQDNIEWYQTSFQGQNKY